MSTFAGTCTPDFNIGVLDGDNIIDQPNGPLDSGSWVEDEPGAVVNDAELSADGVLKADTVEDGRLGDVDGISQFNIDIPADTSVYRLAVTVKKVASTTSYPMIRLRMSGGTPRNIQLIIDPVTGQVAKDSSLGLSVEPFKILSFSSGDYWIIYLFGANDGTNDTLRVSLLPATSLTFEEDHGFDDEAVGTVGFSRISVVQTTGLAACSSQMTHSATASLPFSISVGPQMRGLRIPAALTGDDAIKERVGSRALRQDSSGRSLQRVFVVRGTDDPVAAGDIGPQIGDPDDLDPSFRVASREWGVVAVEGSDGSGSEDGGEANGVLDLTVEYTELRNDFSGINRQSVLTVGAETRHTELAIEQDSEPAPEAEKFGLSIGPEGKDKELKGADVEEPVIEMQETHYVTTFSTGLRTTLLGMAQKVNDAPFRGFAAGEVRFRGFNTRKLVSGQTEIQFTFAVNRQREFEIAVTKDNGDEATASISQDGWQWFWAQFGSKDDNGVKKQITRSVHLATIYEEGNFSSLGIGTAPIT